MTHDVWLELWEAAVPAFEWQKSWAGLGHGVWGFRDGVKIAANYVSTAPLPYMAWVGPEDGGPLESAAFRHQTHSGLVASVLVELDRQGLSDQDVGTVSQEDPQ